MAFMQEAPTLRPLGVGDIVDRVFGIYRSRPLLFVTVAAIPYLLLVLFAAVLGGAFAGSFLALAPLLASPDDVTELLPTLGPAIAALALYALIVGVGALLVSLVQSAALVDATAARYLGRDTTVGRSLRVGLRASPRLLAMGILALLAFLVPWVVAVAVIAATREWYSVVGGVIAAIAGTFYLAASWMVSPAVATLEGIGPLAALRRSWRLSDGHRWRIIGTIALLLVLQVVLTALLSFVLLVSFVTDQTLRLVLQQVVNLLAAIAWAPVYWGTFAVLYYDLRVRKEAYDLQLAAEALPREG